MGLAERNAGGESGVTRIYSRHLNGIHAPSALTKSQNSQNRHGGSSAAFLRRPPRAKAKALDCALPGLSRTHDMEEIRSSTHLRHDTRVRVQWRKN